MPAFTKKSIDKYIRRRMMHWIYSIGRDAKKYLTLELGLTEEGDSDEDVIAIKEFQKKITNDIIVTGGCFTSMLQGDLPNDLDIYMRNKDSAMLLSQMYVKKMQDVGDIKDSAYTHATEVKSTEDGVVITIRSAGIAADKISPEDYRYFEAYPEAAIDSFFAEYKKSMDNNVIESGKGFHVQFMTSNAITLNNGLQLIIRFCGDPETIHTNFDFIHTTNYWRWEEGVVYNEEALTATAEMRLKYFGSKFPVSTVFRLKKFIERGWRISAGEIVKIMYDVSHLDLDDIRVLREQSMGMDSAFFSQVIRMLQERHATNEDIDRTYLFNVISAVFDMNDKMDDFLETRESATESEENDGKLECES